MQPTFTGVPSPVNTASNATAKTGRESPTQGGTLAPHACSNCKNGHRKCDRLLPICTECTVKKKSCAYDELPKKRGPKRGEHKIQTRYEPYVPNSQDEKPKKQRKKKQATQPNMENTHQTQSVLPQQYYREQTYENFISNSAPTSMIPPQTGQMQSPQYNFHMQDVQHTSHVASMSPENHPQQIMPEVLDKYFENLYLNTPVMERAKANSIMYYLRSIEKGPVLSPMMPNNDDMAVIFSMQAWFYKRFALRSLSASCYEKSRDIVSASFDRLHTSFSLASAYGFLGMCAVDDAEFDKAAYYFDNVTSYLKRAQKSRKPPVNRLEAALQALRDEYLFYVMLTGTYYQEANTNLAIIVKSFMVIHYISKRFRGLSDLWEHCGGNMTNDQFEMFAKEYDETIPYLELIRSDLAHGTDNFQLDLNMIDLVWEKYQQSYELFSKQKIVPEVDVSMKKCMYLICCQGHKLQVLKSMGRVCDETARQTADFVTALASTSAFGFCHHIVSQPVALATITHLQCLEQTKDHEGRANLIEKLKLDVKALSVMAEKYPIVRARLSVLISNAEKVVRSNDDHNQLMNLFTSLRGTPYSGSPSQLIPQINLSPNLSYPSGKQVGDISDMFPQLFDGDKKPTNGPFERTDELEQFLNEILNEGTSATKPTFMNRNVTPTTDEVLFL